VKQEQLRLGGQLSHPTRCRRPLKIARWRTLGPWAVRAQVLQVCKRTIDINGHGRTIACTAALHLKSPAGAHIDSPRGAAVKGQEKADRIQRILDDLYPSPPIPLHHSDPYTLLVAVLLSAQCTDARVNTVTPALFDRAGDAHQMSTVPVDEIREIIRPCGLSPTKAKNIRRLSEILMETHHGVVPQSFAELEALPGVGHKTASVVMAQAFGVPAFPVDTHIFRLARRWDLSRGKNVDKVEASLKRAYDKADWNRLHLQIIYFGREYCPARGHDPAMCPICSWAAR
jgi:endonuclease-3